MQVEKHLKITHTDYKLYEVEALQGLEIMSSGANQPLLIIGVVKDTGEKLEFIVKFNAAERMGTASSRCFEYLGACMAKELDLLPAEPVIIEITQDFVDQSVGKDWWRNASNSVGLNYGCHFFKGGRNFAKGETLSPKQYKEAQHIFAFDIFVCNADRCDLKPNMITDGENILIFDHELAFGFIFALFNEQNVTPWIIGLNDERWIKTHYFYPYLKGNMVEFEDFVNKFVNLDITFWSKIEANLPDIWKSDDHITTIKTRTQAFIQNRSLFIEQLKSILA